MVLDNVPSPILIIGSIICIFGGGLAAGLTIGIMSLDVVGLELLIESGDPKEAAYARKLAPIRKKGNLLLVTLLLTNTVFNELLPLFIDHIDGVNAIVALVLPTVTVMIFGEIIPQSVCSRYGLSVGAHCVWVVRGLQLLFFPIAYPMAWLLDKILGEELGTIYSHHQLKGLIDIHSHKRHGALTDVETTILKGALDFSHKKAEDIMVPLESVFMLSAESCIDTEALAAIWQSGRSRIPVYDGVKKTNIVGMLFAKDLLVVRPEDNLPVRTVMAFYGQPVLKVWSDQHLDAIFTDFKSGKCHLAIVQRVNEGTDNSDPFYEPVGIVTLEDVVEELIQDEILDENDQPGASGKRLRPSIASFVAGQARPLPEQVAAVGLYLSRQVDPFKPHIFPEDMLTRLIAKCGCMDIVEKPGQEVMLYTRGQPTNTFTLILNGKFEIQSGDEKIRTEMGPWCFLGLPCLSNPQYKPDYSAKLITPSAQVFVVTHQNYLEALNSITKRSPEFPRKAQKMPISPNPGSAVLMDTLVDFEASPTNTEESLLG